MGWCHEFGSQIREGCDHPMVAGETACGCELCGVSCPGRFSGCATVWARGPRDVGMLVRPQPSGRRARSEATATATQPSVTEPRPADATADLATAGTVNGRGREAPLVNGHGPDEWAGAVAVDDGRAEILDWLRSAFEGVCSDIRALADLVTSQQSTLDSFYQAAETSTRLIAATEVLPERVAVAVAEALSAHQAVALAAIEQTNAIHTISLTEAQDAVVAVGDELVSVTQVLPDQVATAVSEVLSAHQVVALAAVEEVSTNQTVALTAAQEAFRAAAEEVSANQTVALTAAQEAFWASGAEVVSAAAQLPERVATAVAEELPERVAATVAEALRNHYTATVASEEAIVASGAEVVSVAEELPERVATAVAEALSNQQSASLAAAQEAIMTSVAGTLAGVEGLAGELRNELARLSAFRETLATNLPAVAKAIDEETARAEARLKELTERVDDLASRRGLAGMVRGWTSDPGEG